MYSMLLYIYTYIYIYIPNRRTAPDRHRASQGTRRHSHFNPHPFPPLDAVCVRNSAPNWLTVASISRPCPPAEYLPRPCSITQNLETASLTQDLAGVVPPRKIEFQAIDGLHPSMNLEPTDHTVGVAFSQWERPEVFSHVFPSRHNHGRIGRLEHCWTLEMRGNPITVSGHKVTNESIQLVFSGRTFDHATAPRQTCQPDQYEYARSRFDLPRFLAPETSVSTTGLSSPGGIHYACPSTSVALHAASTGRGDCSEHGTSDRDSVISASTREPANTRLFVLQRCPGE